MHGGKVHPVVPMMCENCGHVLMLNALRMGIVERKETVAETTNG
jgi:hypothetical protein